MPIPKKPGELRGCLARHFLELYPPDEEGRHYRASLFVSAAMRALAEYDPCFAKAAEAGEPTFTLRAQDHDLVTEWYYQAWKRLGKNPQDADVLSAQETAIAMRAWPKRKLPD